MTWLPTLSLLGKFTDNNLNCFLNGKHPDRAGLRAIWPIQPNQDLHLEGHCTTPTSLMVLCMSRYSDQSAVWAPTSILMASDGPPGRTTMLSPPTIFGCSALYAAPSALGFQWSPNSAAAISPTWWD